MRQMTYTDSVTLQGTYDKIDWSNPIEVLDKTVVCEAKAQPLLDASSGYLVSFKYPGKETYQYNLICNLRGNVVGTSISGFSRFTVRNKAVPKIEDPVVVFFGISDKPYMMFFKSLTNEQFHLLKEEGMSRICCSKTGYVLYTISGEHLANSKSSTNKNIIYQWIKASVGEETSR